MDPRSGTCWSPRAVLAALALVAPRALKPLNILWFRFGLLLHAIITPVVLGLMFFTVITPLGWLMRAFGKRPLSLGFDRTATSYWIHRTPPGPAPDLVVEPVLTLPRWS